MSAITPNNDFGSELPENRILPTEFEPAIQKRGTKSAKKSVKEPVKKAVVDLFADTQIEPAKTTIKSNPKPKNINTVVVNTVKPVALESKPQHSQSTSETSKTIELIKSDTDPFAHYNSLTQYHKKCLVATNYWRVMNGLEIIPVPEEYTFYHKRFDDRCYELYKKKIAHKNSQN